MTALPLNLDETAWQYAAGKFNAAAKAEFDRGEAAKKAKDATYAVQAYVSEPWQAYAQRIVSGIEASYSDKQSRDHLDIIAKQDPASIARLAKAAALPPGPARDALAAQVNALPAN